MSMKILSRAFVVVLLFLMVGLSGAQEGRPRLVRSLVAKLIAEANQIRESEVTVGPMQAVQEEIGKALTTTDGVCVTFVAPVIEDGRRVRRVQKRLFYHDEDWGWYLFAIEGFRGGEGIDLVSERKGRVILR